jgi:hypothetical protein
MAAAVRNELCPDIRQNAAAGHSISAMSARRSAMARMATVRKIERLSTVQRSNAGR